MNVPHLLKSVNIDRFLSISAIIISIAGVVIAQIQTSTVQEQLKLAGLQIRPYVRYIPEFRVSEKHSKKKAVLVTMHEQNLSPVPAMVFYTQLTPWIDGVAGSWVYNSTRHVRYENKGGASDLPIITGEIAEKIIYRKAQFMIGDCIIYGSISNNDDRRWEARALYMYEPSASEDLNRMILYTLEIEISALQDSCDSSNVRKEWAEQKARVQHSNPGP